MKGCARLGDSVYGVCTDHEIPIDTAGKIVTASANVEVNNIKVARYGDEVELDCGHKATIVGSSPIDQASNQLIARFGDKVAGDSFDGEIISASENVFVNK